MHWGLAGSVGALGAARGVGAWGCQGAAESVGGVRSTLGWQGV